VVLRGSVGASTLPEAPPGGLGGPLAQARRVLALSSAPERLPCRDSEKAAVTKFIEDSMGESPASSGVLYICGIPGTGKTACVMEVLGGLKARAVQRGVQLVTLNALSLPTPQHVYSRLWEKLTGQLCGPARALANLEEMFRGASGSSSGAGGSRAKGGPAAARPGMTLMLVDEIDVLVTKDQSVLYNLFEWPTLPGARLAVIGISNTHDLDSRVLPRIASRLASSKLAFQPYSVEQLRTIVRNRLGAIDVIKDIAVEFAARKVAATSGDVRRVLELLRRALDIADEELRKSKAAAPPSLKDYVTVFSKGCSLGEKLLLVGLMLEMRAGKGKADVSVQALHHRLNTHLGLLMPEAKLSEGQAVALAAGLAAKALLRADPPHKHLRMKVAFKVEPTDVVTSLKEDNRLSPVHAQMGV